jgi:hypothetical protein
MARVKARSSKNYPKDLSVQSRYSIQYLRRTIELGNPILATSVPCYLLPTGDFETLAFDNKYLLESPKFSNFLELARHGDTPHATNLRTRRSVAELSFCLAGGAIAFKSKLQPSVVIATALAAKLGEYLRSFLIELGFPPSGPILHY